MNAVTVVGAGLAGSEAAYQLATRGIPVRLIEMKPKKMTPAHVSPYFAELVCSNSLRSDELTNAVGLLKEELRRLGSIVMRCADEHRVAAGGALAVDREGFARAVTEAVRALPNVEIVEEVGEENAFIFGLSSDEVIKYENYGGYDPMEIFNNDPDIRRVLMQLINGTYAPNDPDRFRTLYNSLLNTLSTAKADTYFILKDFKSYAEAQKRVEAAYRDEKRWAKSAILNVACSGKFTSDRTIQEYVDEIWHLDKVVLPKKTK